MDKLYRKRLQALLDNRRLRAWVFTIVLTDKGSREDAEDMYYLAVAKYWENLEKNVDIQQPEAFVKTVARKNWNQLSKKRRLRRQKMEKVLVDVESMSLDELYISKEQMEIVLKKIRQMGEPCNIILYLFYIEDLRNREISQRLDNGKDADWVRRQMYNCRNKLKDKLRPMSEFQEYF
ncbi:MAG: sigma-70 family RNA polymerase sigma factor [Bacteroidota bacterium]